MRVINQIKGCDDCPLANWEHAVCCHPLAPTTPALELPYNGDMQPPRECPLRAGELLLQLRTK